MRIVAHNGAQIWGGAERATVALLRGLKERGHSVTLLCNADVVARNANARGLDTELCVIGGDIALHHSIRLAMTLKRLAPDAFIIGTFKKLFLAGLGARMGGVPLHGLVSKPIRLAAGSIGMRCATGSTGSQ